VNIQLSVVLNIVIPPYVRVVWAGYYVYCYFFVCFYRRYRFLSQGFNDWRETLHDSSATFQTGFLPFWGDSPRDSRTVGVNLTGGRFSEP